MKIIQVLVIIVNVWHSSGLYGLLAIHGDVAVIIFYMLLLWTDGPEGAYLLFVIASPSVEGRGNLCLTRTLALC